MLVAHDFLHFFNDTKNREHFRIPDFFIYFSSPIGGGWEGAFAPRFCYGLFVERNSPAVITGIFEWTKSFPLRVMMASALAFSAV